MVVVMCLLCVKHPKSKLNKCSIQTQTGIWQHICRVWLKFQKLAKIFKLNLNLNGNAFFRHVYFISFPSFTWKQVKKSIQYNAMDQKYMWFTQSFRILLMIPFLRVRQKRPQRLRWGWKVSILTDSLPEKVQLEQT